MRDPQVVWLEYDLKSGWVFDNPPRAVADHRFDSTLKDGCLHAEMRHHFTTVEEARSATEPFLKHGRSM
jgi:hypothetical protein